MQMLSQLSHYLTFHECEGRVLSNQCDNLPSHEVPDLVSATVFGTNKNLKQCIPAVSGIVPGGKNVRLFKWWFSRTVQYFGVNNVISPNGLGRRLSGQKYPEVIPRFGEMRER